MQPKLIPTNRARDDNRAHDYPRDNSDYSGNYELALHIALNRRAGFRAVYDVALLRLSANAHWQNTKKRNPPDE